MWQQSRAPTTPGKPDLLLNCSATPRTSAILGHRIKCDCFWNKNSHTILIQLKTVDSVRSNLSAQRRMAPWLPRYCRHIRSISEFSIGSKPPRETTFERKLSSLMKSRILWNVALLTLKCLQKSQSE